MSNVNVAVEGLSAVSKAHDLLEVISRTVESLPPIPTVHFDSEGLVDANVTQDDDMLIDSSETMQTDPQMKELIEISNSSEIISLPPQCPETTG